MYKRAKIDYGKIDEFNMSPVEEIIIDELKDFGFETAYYEDAVFTKNERGQLVIRVPKFNELYDSKNLIALKLIQKFLEDARIYSRLVSIQDEFQLVFEQ